MRFHNPNLCKHPQDPEYDNSFNEEDAYDAYEEALLERYELERENQ